MMSRILALDYGLKRTGIAVTDPLCIIATALTVVPSKDLIDFLKKYLLNESVKTIVIGMPKTLMNEDSENAANVKKILKILKRTFPAIPVNTIDERFTSSIAMDTMIRGGMKKKDRREKGNVDKISAVLILQSFLEQYGK